MSIEITREVIESATNDDMEFWLANKFVDTDDLIAKVCWWASAVIEAHLADLIRVELTGDEVVEAVADALPDLHWCESNYTRGCNCLDDRRRQARAALAAVVETLGVDR